MKTAVLLSWLMASLVLAIAQPSLAAEKYPSKLIKLIVPYPPGGGIDPTARIFAQALGDELGQPIVILNTGGASGQIGTQQAARSAADGYTLLFASVAPNAILPAVLAKIPYSNKDFIPVSLVGIAAYILVGNASLPVDNIDQLLGLMKTKPAAVDRYASSGTLGGPHLAGALFSVLSHVPLTHVPYRGDGPAVTAVLSGDVPIAFASAPSVVQQVEGGQLKAFGISGKDRSPLLPDAPALGKTMPGLEVSQWYGLMAPAGTPPDIVARLNEATNKVLSGKELMSQLAKLGVVSRPGSAAEFRAFVDAEVRKYKSLAEMAVIAATE